MIDFSLDELGEFSLDEDNKLNEVSEDELRKQIAFCRIKSVTTDWFGDKVGADLEQFLGYPNTTNTLSKVLYSITESLTNDNFIKNEDIYIIPKATERAISFLVFINKIYDEGPLIINVTLDIVGGVRVKYDLN